MGKSESQTHPVLIEGIVLRASAGGYSVQTDTRVVHCTVRGNLKKEFRYSTSAARPAHVIRAKHPSGNDVISVGDRVRFSDTHHNAGVIEEVMPRRTRFTRLGFRGREQTIVCNIDQLVIVFACIEPRPDPWIIDRFLVAAEAEGLDPLIVTNKRDRVTDEEWHGAFDLWSRLGYRVLSTSAKRAIGVQELCDALKDRVSAVVGPSGVGKSSLLNAVQPGLNLQTGDIGYVTHKGRHTTTASQLIPLRFGGWVADTPGLRQLELLRMDRAELADCFPEFRPYLGQCRFANCSHGAEPDCAVKAAIDDGVIDRRRHESYLILAKEIEGEHRR